MANQKVGVTLEFTADAKGTKRQLQELQQELTKLTQKALTSNTNLGLTKEINDAINAVSELQIKLKQSTSEAGSLDLGKFKQSLESSGKTLAFYADQLGALGPEGTAAFSKIAQAITTAEVPLKRTSKLLNSFSKSLKDAFRWQVSSSILHGLQGSIQQAYYYAEDLNESLTNIRIVTGLSAEEMEKFAIKANKAAKELSATTVEYADAALIFYQQGLTDEEVERRTATTIKMAHAAGESADEVSSYMTAIWNNFAKGLENLDYFGDVISKLGAETAASSAEIAQGLEKFAAIGETVGLSYEYATSAVATVIDKTRQSADTVGTAFKTIFSRLQGLQLGETLDDGTTLNKYSSALMSVGINIKEANGSLKDMDVILDELGVKWRMLRNDEQMALAQTVAGVRQYNQLIALMNNFEAFKSNVATAAGSSGTLNEQQETYAEGWEAAADRVRTALEGIYNSVVDDDVLVPILNDVEKIVSAFGVLVDSAGGLTGILPIVARLMTGIFKKDIANTIERMSYNFRLFSKKGKQDLIEFRKQATEALNSMYQMGDPHDSAVNDGIRIQNELHDTLIEKTEELYKLNNSLTEEEKNQAKVILDINNMLKERYSEHVKGQQQHQTNTEILKDSFVDKNNDQSLRIKSREGNVDFLRKIGLKPERIDDKKGNIHNELNLQKGIDKLEELSRQYGLTQSVITKYKKAINSSSSTLDGHNEEVENAVNGLKEFKKAMYASGQELGDLENYLNNIFNAYEDMKDIKGAFGGLEEYLNGLQQNSSRLFNIIKTGLENNGQNDLVPELQQLQQEFIRTGALTEEQAEKLAKLSAQAEKGGEAIRNMGGHVATMGDVVSEGVNSFTSFAMGLSGIQSFVDEFGDSGPSLQSLVSAMFMLGEGIDTVNQYRKLGTTIQNFYNTATKNGTRATIAAATASQTLYTALGPISIAIAAITLALSAYNKAIEKQNEKLKENAEKTKEVSDEAYEETKAFEEQKKAFDDALSSYKDGIGTKADLRKVSLDLCETYGIENGELLVATGRYEELAEAIKKVEKAKRDEAIQKAEGSADAATEVLKTSFKEGVYAGFTTQRYRVNLGSVSNATGVNSEIFNSLKKAFNESDYSRKDDLNEFVFILEDIKNATSEDYIRFYEDIQKTFDLFKTFSIEAGVSEDRLENTTVYERMLDWLSNNEAEYQLVKEAQERISELNISDIAYNLEDKDSFNSLKEYNELQKELTDQIQQRTSLSEEEAKTEANRLLLVSKKHGELATAYQAISEYSKNSGIETEKLVEKYNELTDEDKQLFLSIDFDKIENENELEAEIKRLQRLAYGSEIKLRLEATRTAISKYKEGMSSSELVDFVNDPELNYLWNDKYTKENFLSSSHEDRIAFLSKQENRFSNENLGESGNTRQLENTLKEQEQKIDTLESKLATLSTNVIIFPDLDKYDATIKLSSPKLSYIKEIQEEIESLEIEKEATEAALKESEQLDKAEESNLRDRLTNFTNKLSQMDIGDTLSIEEFSLLEENFDGLNKNFIQLEDGSYKLVRGISEVRGAFFKLKDESKDYVAFEKISLNVENLNKKLKDNTITNEQFNQKYSELLKDFNSQDINTEEFEEYRKALIDAKVITEDTEETLVLEYYKISRGLTTLGSNFNQWHEWFTTQSKETQEYTEALNGFKGVISDITGIMPEFITDEFITKNMDKVLAAANGSKEAIQDIFDTLKYSILTGVSAAGQNALQMASTMTTEDAIGLINRALAIGTLTLDAATAFFETVGQKLIVEAGQVIDIINDNIIDRFETSITKLGATRTTKDLSEIDLSQKKRQDEEIERYHVINNQLESIGYNLDVLKKKKDRAFGSDRLRLLDRETKMLEKQLKLEKQKLAEAQNYVDQDLNSLSKYGFKVDINGDITNYEQIMKAKIDEYNANYDAYIAAKNRAENTWNTGAQNETTQKIFDNAIKEAEKQWENYQRNYDQFTKDLNNYEESVDIFKQSKDSIMAIQDELSALKLEELSYPIELRLELNDSQMKMIETQLKILEDDFYALNEAMVLQYGGADISFGTNQYNEYIQNLSLQKSLYEGLNEAYEDRSINSAQYNEKLGETYDVTLDNVNSLIDLDKAMKNYYGDTLAAAKEELGKYTDRLEHQTSVLEHYKNLMDLLGKEIDYERIGDILEAQSIALENEMQVAEKELQIYTQEVSKWKTLMDNANSEEEKEIYKKSWEAAEEAMREAQERMLAKTEAWASKMKEIFENNVAKAAQRLENSLTGGTSFNQVNTSLERAKSLQEEYLTATNQIYETTKLMRTAQQAIDKTTNTVAKQRIKGFLDETKALQEKERLSKYELELQQAKYDLVIAQIALEEAQAAKTTVRIQRDIEGNFGYVYTASAEAVAEAQQKVDDMENDLYNLSLEGANEYTEKRLQAFSEMYDALNSLRREDFETDEEYLKAREEIQEYYFQKIEDYTELHGIAITEKNTVMHDNNLKIYESLLNAEEQYRLDMLVKQGILAEDQKKAFELYYKDIAKIDEAYRNGEIASEKEYKNQMAAAKRDLYIQLQATGTTGLNEYHSALGKIDEAYHKGEITSEEEYLKAIESAKSVFFNNIKDLSSNSALGAEIDSAIVRDAWSTSFNDMNNDAEVWKDAVIEYNNEVDSAYEELDRVIQNTEETLDNSIGTVEDITAANEDLADEINNNVISAIEDVIEAVGNSTEIYAKNRLEIINLIGEYRRLAEEMLKTKQASIGSEELSESSTSDSTSNKSSSTTTSNSTSSTVTSKGENMPSTAPKVGDKLVLKKGAKYTTGGLVPSQVYGWDLYIQQIGPKSIVFGPKNGGITGAVWRENVEGFRTGGYTGEWGPQGKLAVLHQKEIVLNQEDTSNLLASVSMLREILSVIDLHAANAQFAGLVSSPSFTYGNNGTLEQNVHIEASFPSVTDRNEIEEAFNNLVNKASQFANRK